MKKVEIERKFLVDKEKWSRLVKPEGTLYRQGYLVIDREKVVRVRTAGEKGYLTIKGRSDTTSRPEYEYEIPLVDAAEMLEKFVPGRIEKIRTKLAAGGHTWEVDEFLGLNKGLLLAEIELDDPEEQFKRPEWLGEEVTGDPRYYNSYLSENPYSFWKKNEQ